MFFIGTPIDALDGTSGWRAESSNLRSRTGSPEPDTSNFYIFENEKKDERRRQQKEVATLNR